MASSEQIMRRGVNLGGWLVLEPWITPSLFAGTEAIDEYTYCHMAMPAMRRALTKHRDTFITEADFAWLAEHGIDTVRLPVGYWLFGDAEPFVATLHYVDQAYVWAAKHGLKILLDVHGAPGSQNGEDHSGCKGAVGWHQDPANIQATLDCITKLVARYGHHPAWLGLAVLNEPKRRIPQHLLLRFYKQAYAIIQREAAPDSWVVISDSFQPWRWYLAMPRRRYPQLLIDHHHYQMFFKTDKYKTAQRHIAQAKRPLRHKIWRMARFHRVIIGEWCMALPREVMQKVPDSQKRQVMHDYAAAQQVAFAPVDGWFFWTYKTEAQDGWSLRDQIALSSIGNAKNVKK